MTPAAHLSTDDSAYLVERYISAASVADLPAAVARLARVCHATDDTTDPVRYLHSAFVPAEDTCFCLFQANSSAAVRTVNRDAGFSFDRISLARLIEPPC